MCDVCRLPPVCRTFLDDACVMCVGCPLSVLPSWMMYVCRSPPVCPTFLDDVCRSPPACPTFLDDVCRSPPACPTFLDDICVMYVGRPLPVLPSWMMPKVWGMSQHLLPKYIETRPDGGCNIGGEKCLQVRQKQSFVSLSHVALY